MNSTKRLQCHWDRRIADRPWCPAGAQGSEGCAVIPGGMAIEAGDGFDPGQ